jgi:3'-5' exoribonuclease
MTAPDYPKLLSDLASSVGVLDVYSALMRQYPQFNIWAGSHASKLHHCEKGGLVRHTWETANLGLSIIPMLNLGEKVDATEFYLAALFHDTGKLYDYSMLPDGIGVPAPHKRLIYHIPRSTLIWHDVVMKFPALNEKYHDAVLHDILAHHGTREYGSPIAPKTHAAWLLHLCDSISARMDDADRIDVMHIR